MAKNFTKIGWFGFATVASATSFGQLNASADAGSQIVDLTAPVDGNHLNDSSVRVIAENANIQIVADFLPITTNMADVAENSSVDNNFDQNTVSEYNIDSVLPDNASEKFDQLDLALTQANLVGYNATIVASAADKSNSSTVTADLTPATAAPAVETDDQPTASNATSNSGDLPSTGQADETYLNIAGSLTMAVATLSMARFIFYKRR